MNVRTILAAAVLGMATLAPLTLAQDAGNNNNNGGGGGGGDRGNRGGDRGNNAGGGGGGGERGQRGNFDPAQFRQQMMQRFKEQLKVPDDEWKVIEPKLVKVMDAQRDLRGPGGFGGGGFGGGRRGGGGGGGGDQQPPTTEIGIAQRDLRTAVEAEGTSQDEIDKKLATYRAAREKAEAALEAARKDLKEVLSARQEAALVLAGQLE